MQTFCIWHINSESLLISVVTCEWLIHKTFPVINVLTLFIINIFGDQFVGMFACNF